MNYSVTLQTLRKHGACYYGYNKVVRALQGEEFTEEDECRESYIRFNHKEEIPLTFILKNNGFDDTLWTLRCFESIEEAERDTRLFAVWCARQVQHLMQDDRSIEALDVAENGREELEVARDAAYDAAYDAYARAAAYAVRAAAYAAAHAADAAYASATDRAAAYAASATARAAAYAADAASARADAASAAKKAQEEMLLLMLENKAPWQVSSGLLQIQRG